MDCSLDNRSGPFDVDFVLNHTYVEVLTLYVTRNRCGKLNHVSGFSTSTFCFNVFPLMNVALQLKAAASWYNWSVVSPGSHSNRAPYPQGTTKLQYWWDPIFVTKLITIIMRYCVECGIQNLAYLNVNITFTWPTNVLENKNVKLSL
jgi:hypothetical protein